MRYNAAILKGELHNKCKNLLTHIQSNISSLVIGLRLVCTCTPSRRACARYSRPSICSEVLWYHPDSSFIRSQLSPPRRSSSAGQADVLVVASRRTVCYYSKTSRHWQPRVSVAANCVSAARGRPSTGARARTSDHTWFAANVGRLARLAVSDLAESRRPISLQRSVRPAFSSQTCARNIKYNEWV